MKNWKLSVLVHLTVCSVVFMQFMLMSKTRAEDSKPLHDQSTAILRPGPEYGTELKSEPLKVGPTMDVAIAGDYVYAIGSGELRVLSNAREGKPEVIGRLGGFGNTRQIAVSRSHAFITSREEGLFIVDVSSPTQPKLAYHYDTAELATAIAVSGDVAAIGSRFAGIELLGVSKPREPKYLATIRVGEVQSLAFQDSLLLAGIWSQKAVAIVDVSNPWKPVLTKSLPLEAKGDGLDVSGNLLAAATGHHARSKGSPRPGDGAFGHGHGIEFFDLANPAEPKRLSRVSFPPFYRLGMDMWGVVLAGGHAFVNDTHNGFFLIDVRDPSKPRNIGWKQLPVVRGDPSPVAGLAVTQGRVYLAGGFDDLHLVDTAIRNAEPRRNEVELTVPAPPTEREDSGLPAYVVDGSIRSVIHWKDDLLLAAAGSAGLHVVQQKNDSFHRIAVYPTRGFARDVACCGDKVFVAELLGGLSIWKANPNESLERISVYEEPGKSIHQVVLADDGRIAFLAVGSNALHVIKISPDGKTAPAMSPMKNSGLFYREPFSSISSDGKRLLVQWHVNGLFEFTFENGNVKRGEWTYPHPMGTECGAAPWRDGWVVTSHRGTFFLAHGETRSPEQLGFLKHSGSGLPGKPSIYENKLFISDPFLGTVTAAELTDDKSLQVIQQLHLTGHPGRVKVISGKVLIPAGRDGLLMWSLSE